MSKVMFVGEDTRIVDRLGEAGNDTQIEVERTGWNDVSMTLLGDREPDLILLDLTAPEAVDAKILSKLQAEKPDLPIVIVVDLNTSVAESLRPLLRPGVEVVGSHASSEELGRPVHRLLSTRPATEPVVQPAGRTGRRSVTAPILSPSIPSLPAFPHLAPDLRNPKSGRLDAKKVSKLFGIPLGKIAMIAGGEPAAVYKTPDALSLQPGLALFERIASALLHLVGSYEGLRIWLNAPEPDLEGETPRALLLEREGDVVAELLEDMMAGQPG